MRTKGPVSTTADTVGLAALRLERPLAVLDLDATGVDVAADRAVEVAVVRVSPGGGRTVFHRRLNPGVPIPAASTAVHGIGDADVADCPPFVAIAGDLFGVLAGADLAGFGIARFDVPLLAAKFGRTGRAFPLAGRAVVDALAVFHRYKRRDLAAAVRWYLGSEHDRTHPALANARAALACWTPRWPVTGCRRPRPNCIRCWSRQTLPAGCGGARTAASSSGSASTPDGRWLTWPGPTRPTWSGSWPMCHCWTMPAT